jgi:hypothetical protein
MQIWVKDTAAIPTRTWRASRALGNMSEPDNVAYSGPVRDAHGKKFECRPCTVCGRPNTLPGYERHPTCWPRVSQ